MSWHRLGRLGQSKNPAALEITMSGPTTPEGEASNERSQRRSPLRRACSLRSLLGRQPMRPPHVPDDRSAPSGGVDTDQTMTPGRSPRSAPDPAELPARPSGDAVEPLKLRKDQDPTPLLEKKCPEQLLAIRKATAETLAKRSRELGHWATVQAQILRQGLRALDVQIRVRGIETGQPTTRQRSRSRGFEFLLCKTSSCRVR